MPCLPLCQGKWNNPYSKVTVQRLEQLTRWILSCYCVSFLLFILHCSRDLMCCAQTGSGKTCAFLLPVVVRLGRSMEQGYLGRKWNDHFDGTAAAPIAIVLAPTRELAIQIELEAEKLCNASGLIACTVYGGSPAPRQLSILATGVDILVGTPGRLQDFIDRGTRSFRLLFLKLN